MLTAAASANRFVATSSGESCQTNNAAKSSNGATMKRRPWWSGARPTRSNIVRTTTNDTVQIATFNPRSCPRKSRSPRTPSVRADPARTTATFVSRLICPYSSKTLLSVLLMQRRAWSLDLRDLGLCDAVGADLGSEHLFLDPRLVFEEIGIRLGQRDSDAIGEGKPCVLTHRVELMDEVEDAGLESQLVVELGRDRDGERVVFGERPALTGASLDEHLVGALHHEPTERLAKLESGFPARLSAELDHAAHLRYLREEPFVERAPLRPALEEDRSGVLVGAQHAPQVLGQERHHRRDHLHRADEREPELLKRGLVVASPKPSARAADVPVRKVVDEGHEGAGDVRRPEAVVGIRHVGNKLIGAGPQPAIERVRGVGLGGSGPEMLDIRGVDEKLYRVPQP